jgi:hypothetical protein
LKAVIDSEVATKEVAEVEVETCISNARETKKLSELEPQTNSNSTMRINLKANVEEEFQPQKITQPFSTRKSLNSKKKIEMWTFAILDNRIQSKRRTRTDLLE